MKNSFVAQPHSVFRIGDFLDHGLKNPAWSGFRAAVAFVKRSGTKHVLDALKAFGKRGTTAISVGIDAGGTSAEGLLDLIDSGAKTWIFHNANRSTFHPKIFLFTSKTHADLMVGSGNLTEGGLYSNYEASMRTTLDLSKGQDRRFLMTVEAALDAWSTPASGICMRLSEPLLRRLVRARKVLPEALTREMEEAARAMVTGAVASKGGIFKRRKVRPAPKVRTIHLRKPSWLRKEEILLGSAKSTFVTAAFGGTAFLMTLQNTDVGYGRKTAGATRRSPEIFVPMRAVDTNPGFWEWPTGFSIDSVWSSKHAAWIARKKTSVRRSSRPLEKLDRQRVTFKTVHAGKVVAPIWYNPDKVDIRIRHEKLRMAGQVGDILVLRTTSAAGFDYEFEVVSKADPRFPALDAQCSTKVPNSAKRYAYV